jgi:curved DNA-binding protein CbpA
MDEAEFRDWAERVRRAWEALDTASYYQVLGVPPDAPQEIVRQAFHRRATQLHPDRHRATAEPTRGQAYALFKRMTEAYRVLTDPDLRRVYDEGLAGGTLRLADEGSMPPRPSSPEELLRTPLGRQYHRAAVEAVAHGDDKAAELNLKLVVAHEGELPFLTEMLAKIRARRKG